MHAASECNIRETGTLESKRGGHRCSGAVDIDWVPAAGMQTPRSKYRPGKAALWPFAFIAALAFVLLANPLVGMAQESRSAASVADRRDQLCPMLVTVAQANALPIEFFARVIWQESHFQS